MMRSYMWWMIGGLTTNNHSDLYVDMGLPSKIKWGQNYPDDNLDYSIDTYVYANWAAEGFPYWTSYKYNHGAVRAGLLQACPCVLSGCRNVHGQY